MRKLPLWPTLLVAVAVAIMIGLGVWQLQRASEKRDLLERFSAAQGLPPIAYPSAPDPRNPPLYRRASAMCLVVADWRAASGRNAAGESGWIHIAACRAAAGGSGFQAVMGWSRQPASPDWKGGPVTGVIGSDRDHIIRLVATDPAPGLIPARPPSLDDVPDNHLAYALQWFFFAAAAAVIYVLALRRRSR